MITVPILRKTSEHLSRLSRINLHVRWDGDLFKKIRLELEIEGQIFFTQRNKPTKRYRNSKTNNFLVKRPLDFSFTWKQREGMVQKSRWQIKTVVSRIKGSRRWCFPTYTNRGRYFRKNAEDFKTQITETVRTMLINVSEYAKNRLFYKSLRQKFTSEIKRCKVNELEHRCIHVSSIIVYLLLRILF